jgi:hypothetical protein
MKSQLRIVLISALDKNERSAYSLHPQLRCGYACTMYIFADLPTSFDAYSCRSSLLSHTEDEF